MTVVVDDTVAEATTGGCSLGLVGSVVGGVVANALGADDVFELNVLGSLVAIAAAIVLIVVGDRVGLLRRRASGS